MVDNVRRVIAKMKEVVIEKPYDLRQSHGASLELIEAVAKEQGKTVNTKSWDDDEQAHQDLSRAQSSDKFKGGLAGTSDVEKNLHTATHLLQRALRNTLGEHVQQMGSNINQQRLRFDFAHDARMTDEELKKVEDEVNKIINDNLPVKFEEMPIEKARNTGAVHFFKEKYGDSVKVYYVGDNLENAYSKEFCGGPHANSTGELGHFKILKEESVAKGVRRIKAVLN